MASKAPGIFHSNRGFCICLALALAGALSFCAKAALAQSAAQPPKPAQTSQPVLARLPANPPAHSAAAKSSAPAGKIDLMVPSGTPLRVSLLKKVKISKVDDPVVAEVTEPVYSFDRVVIPAGSKVTGKVAQIIPATKFRRTEAILNGDFTPLKTAKVEFDTLILSDGARMPIETTVSPGIQDVIRLVTKQDAPKKPGLVHEAERAVDAQWHGAIHEVKTVASLHWLKKTALSELPYHRQYLGAGTVYEAELVHPLDFGKETIAPGALADYGDPPPPNSVVHARLLTALSSATAHKGTKVEAVMTKPLFSEDKHLLLPEGTQLLGEVVQVHPARGMHRNGLLRIAIRKMELPSGATAAVDASIQGLAVSRKSNIALDSEGGASVPERKQRYLDTALSLAIATSTFDSDAGRVGHQNGDLSNRGVAGGSGFRLVGLILGVAVQSRTVGQVLGIYGAGWSVYDHFIAHGRDVILAKDTPMTIGFGSQQPTGR
ncbi:MAG: hypothetical protein KGL59_08520 [Acidobacteriota bacterium]|nr:hypothetical protein [Acidobacteriota bacterium]